MIINNFSFDSIPEPTFEKILSNLQKRVDSNFFLSSLCLYSKRDIDVGHICTIDYSICDFYGFCPNFRCYKNSEKPYKFFRYDISENTVTTTFIGIIVFGIGLVISVLEQLYYLIPVFFTVSLLIASSSGYYINKLFMPKYFAEIGKMPFVFFYLARYILENKPNSGEDEKLIFIQQSTKIFGPKYLKYAKYFMNSDINYNLNLSKFSKTSNYTEVKIVLSLLCTILVYNNFEIKDNDKILTYIKNQLNYKGDITFEINSKINLQKNFIERKKENELKLKQKARIMTRKDKYFYLEVLGLDSNASEKEISHRFRELAVKYHPDKFVNALETEKNKASDKFKEISEAYNFLKELNN